MEISIIWNLSNNDTENMATLQSLRSELNNTNITAQIMIYPANKEQYSTASGFFPNHNTYICQQDGLSVIEACLDASEKITGKYVTQLHGGDTFSENSISQFYDAASSASNYNIIMMKKILENGDIAPFSNFPNGSARQMVNLKNTASVMPFYFGGTWIKSECLKKENIHAEYGLEAEREFFLSLCAQEQTLLYLSNAIYKNGTVREGDAVFYENLYKPAWYKESFTEFWIPYLEGYKANNGIPAFIQYHLMFTVKNRILANTNNLNKHVVPIGQEMEHLNYFSQVFQYIDDDILFDCRKIPECNMADSYKWLYGVFKHGENYHFDTGYLAGKPYYRAPNTFFNKVETLKTNVVFLNYEEASHTLLFEGTVHPILHAMADSVYLSFNNKSYALRYTERYAHTKIYGVSVYKSHAFSVRLPLSKATDATIYCYANIRGEIIKIQFSYQSHFSRIGSATTAPYWCFGSDPMYMMTKSNGGLNIKNSTVKQARRQELRVQKRLLLSKSMHDKKMLLVRMAYFAAKPFIKTKPIWMYLDKIYKGGDSSEYLFRYASAQKEDIKHYYLIDKKSSDYKRLKKDGFRPLIRGSIKHRLIFLMADMMVISNSTVFAFNDFGMKNSSYVRDLVDFHVCCVQHGMSVQKIAIAQNRLRDNTRLYFCASKYEIQNLSRPIYDYYGHSALKLTGVPRYDGLVDRAQKQIMISPTWRMQAAVPVRTNEGQQRDYNPLFKESSYYKVFNALINDPRLIDAAKRYGYRIKYVLHPIVSAQADDFDKNEYVDIIPAVGDMSYEKMFCESSLMVTDFSGIQFDFAYMRKPLIYLHHRDIPQHYEEGSFFYETMGFGEICHDNDELIDLLCEYMENDCRMKPEYVRRADDFFFYNDHNNCKRIYETMLEYQKRYIYQVEEKPSFTLSSPAVQETSLGWKVPETCQQKADALIAQADDYHFSATTTDFYHNCPLNENQVLILGLGKNVRGNMHYILDELNHSPRYSQFEIFVRTGEDTEAIVQTFIEENHWSRTHTVTENIYYNQLMCQAKYLITETYFPDNWVKKEGQISINIWHGTPLKKLGLAKNSESMHTGGRTQRNFIDADYLLYPNQYTKQHMLESYKVCDLLSGKTVMLGYPRTGGLLENYVHHADEIYRCLAPNSEHIYAYMPTWRDYLPSKQVVNECKDLLFYLDQNLRDDQILYVNLHHRMDDVLNYDEFSHIRRFPATMDSYKLLSATEALITDYSSVFFDYLATKKHIILYCSDYAEYEANRGTYMDLMSLPFDKAMSKEQLLDALNRGKTYDDTDAHREFCNYDSTENARKLCSLLLDKPDADVLIEPVPKSGKRQVLLFSEECRNATETKLVQKLVENHNEDMYQLYIGCISSKVSKNLENAYPMLYNVPTIGSNPDPFLTVRGKTLLALYREKKISFSEAVDYLKYDYAAMAKRMYGAAKFDLAMLYDIQDPKLFVVLSLLDCPKVLFVPRRIMLRVLKDEIFLKDAFIFACLHASVILVDDTAKVHVIQELCEQPVNVQVMSLDFKLDDIIQDLLK